MYTLDPGLAAAITLQQLANPTDAKGNVTVAAKLAAQAGQGIAGALPQQGRQQGIAGILPQQDTQQGMPGAIADAQQAMPSVVQNAEQDKMEKLAGQVAQHMKASQGQQQMLAEGGLAGIPARNMGFDEGGIVPMMPADVDTPEMASFRNRQTQLEKLQNSRPDFSAQQLAALDADKQARAAVSAKREAAQMHPIFDMAARWRREGAAGGLEAVKSRRMDEANRMEASRVADKLDAAERIKIAEAEAARKEGNINKMMEADKELAGIRNQQRQLQSSVYGHDVSKYGVQTKAQVDREQITASDARAQADREARALEAKADRGSREYVAGLGQDLKEEALDLKRFQTAASTGKIAELAKKMVSLQGIGAAKPQYDATFNEYRKAYNELATRYNQPLLAESGGTATGGTSTALPPAVAAALAKHAKGS